MLVFAAAAAGFLPFNFPRARIFMGDVGSGVLGLLIAVAVLWQMSAPGHRAASGVVLCSAFVTDASCTLVSRIVRGRRWYSAHREHLYQWLVRSGFSPCRRRRALHGMEPRDRLAGRSMDEPGLRNMDADRQRERRDAESSGVAAATAVYALGVAVWIARQAPLPRRRANAGTPCRCVT